jgi:uncharacterized membrane protein
MPLLIVMLVGLLVLAVVAVLLLCAALGKVFQQAEENHEALHGS